jgi:hypothetical protein
VTRQNISDKTIKNFLEVKTMFGKIMVAIFMAVVMAICVVVLIESDVDIFEEGILPALKVLAVIAIPSALLIYYLKCPDKQKEKINNFFATAERLAKKLEPVFRMAFWTVHGFIVWIIHAFLFYALVKLIRG